MSSKINAIESTTTSNDSVDKFASKRPTSIVLIPGNSLQPRFFPIDSKLTNKSNKNIKSGPSFRSPLSPVLLLIVKKFAFSAKLLLVL